MTSASSTPPEISASPPRRRPRWVVLVLANLLGILGLLLACEIAARGIVWAWGIPTEFQPVPFQGFGQTDPVVWWRLRPDLDTWMNNIRLRTNSEGFRHRSQPQTPKALQIYCLGDSTTFGWGVRENQMYTSLAAEALREATGQQVEIVSTGVPGYTSYQCLEQFRQQIAAKRPDVVVVMASNNECRARSVGDRDRGRMLARKRTLHRLLGFSRIWVLLSRAPETLTRTWDLEPPPGRVADTREEYVQNLSELVAEAQAVGSRLVFMNMPLHLSATPIWTHHDRLAPEVASLLRQAEQAETDDRRETLLREAIRLQPDQHAAHWELAQVLDARSLPDEARQHRAIARESDLHPDAAKPSYNQALASFCRDRDVPMIDLDRAFRESELTEADLFLDHCHPSPAGHRIIAEELATTLRQLVSPR